MKADSRALMYDAQNEISTATRPLESSLLHDHNAAIYAARLPLVEGHVEIEPVRIIESISDMTRDELVSAFTLTGKYMTSIAHELGVEGVNIICSEGAAAGQKGGPQIHVMPRNRSENTRQGLYNKGGFLHMPDRKLRKYYKSFDVTKRYKIQETSKLEVLHCSADGKARILRPHVGATDQHFLAVHDDLGLLKPFENPEAAADLYLLVKEFRENMIPIADGYQWGFNVGPSAGQFHDKRVMDVVPYYEADAKHVGNGVTDFYPWQAPYTRMKKQDNVETSVIPALKIN